MVTTRYTPKDLRREARNTIRFEARAAKCRVRFLDWALLIQTPEALEQRPGDRAVLVAYGERLDNGLRFDIRVTL